MRVSFAAANITLVVTLILTTNCDNVRLNLRKMDQASTAAKVEICAAPPDDQSERTKILFLVDKSGSNADGLLPNGTLRPGTDNGVVYRHKLIKDFLDTHRTNPTIDWGMVAFGFQQELALAYVNEGLESSPSFTSDPAVMDQALARLQSDTDIGGTPYRKAMSMAIQSIKADKLKNSTGLVAKYIVVLISDGQPTDYNIGNTTQIDEAAIQRDVLSLVAEGTSLNTIYYGSSTALEAARLLERMAGWGEGKFSDVNKEGRVPLDRQISLPTVDPWLIKNFVVMNLNSAPCDDGTIGADSDADGLCDIDENRYNSEFSSDPLRSQRMKGKLFNPFDRNSFSTAYNDLIYYRAIVYGEGLDETCSDLTDEDRDLLNECEEAFIKTRTPSGPNNAWTQKMGLAANPKNFDSDGDGFLDSQELKFSLGRLTADAMDFNSTNKTVNGFRMDEVMLQNRNPINPRGSLAYDPKFKFSGVNSNGQNCYSYDQSLLPVYNMPAVGISQASGNLDLVHGANENVIMIYYIQSPEAETNAPANLRYKFQRIKVNSNLPLKLDLDVNSYDSFQAVW